MRLLNLVRQFLDDLRAQRLRTALTVLGITWGTVAVVVLLAFGSGLEEQMKTQARGMGDGIVIVFGGRTTKAFRGFGEGRPIRLRESDVGLLAREIPEIRAISPEYGRWEPARLGTAVTNVYVTGIAPVYGEMRNVIPEPGGRFIDRLDVDHRRRVAVLGDEVKRTLFGDADAVGKEFFIGDTPFLVVGVMQKKRQGSSYQTRDQNRVFIPASTHAALFGARTLSNIVYKPTTPALAPAVRERVYEVLGRRYTFDPTDHDAVAIWDTTEMMKMFDYIFLGFNLFLAIVGSFTLTVGGIGVANIMYIVVRERTREIGIKRSIGAKRRDILFQFLFEASLVVAAGAVLGFLVSFALVELIGMLPIQEFVGRATISPLVITVTLSLLGVIAALAGLFPARRAANLDVVECLRA
ncbi:MAG TPA: ABC transporter permease [Longimicrobiales bacterium]